MKISRYNEEQIIAVLKEHQAGVPVAELCRKHGISDATFYNWRSRYGGLQVSDARRLKCLEEENRRLQKLLARSDGFGPAAQVAAPTEAKLRNRNLAETSDDHLSGRLLLHCGQTHDQSCLAPYCGSGRAQDR